MYTFVCDTQLDIEYISNGNNNNVFQTNNISTSSEQC